MHLVKGTKLSVPVSMEFSTTVHALPTPGPTWHMGQRTNSEKRRVIPATEEIANASRGEL